jgi:hypothetical protein
LDVSTRKKTMSELPPKELERIRSNLNSIIDTPPQGTYDGWEFDLMRRDGKMLLSALDALQKRLDTNTCNSGHVTLPLVLWDCPECHDQTRRERNALRIQVQELTDRLFEVTKTLPSAVAHKEEDA